jgi:hypothetical protein
MSDTFTPGEIRSTLGTLRGYLRDLAEAKFEQFTTKLRLFVNFCEKDDIVRVIARNLHVRSGDVKAWFTAVAAGAAPELPQGAVERLAHRYMTLSEMKRQGLEPRTFISTVFSGHSIFNEAWAAFRADYLEPFAQDFVRRLEALEAKLPEAPDARVDLEAAVAEALASEQPATPAPAAPPAPAAAPAPAAKGGKKPAKPIVDPGAALEDLVKTLGATVKKARGLVAGVKKDVETDLKILKLELSKSEPNRDVLAAVVRPLERIGGEIAEIAGAIRAKVQ